MKRGFSLVEVITVLFVISLGLVGILSLIIQNIQSQSYNKNNLIAYQLAQEGIELVRKVRDSNWRSNNVSFAELLSPGQYFISYNDVKLHEYNSSVPAELILKQDVNGFYFHDLTSSDPASGFSRRIILENYLGGVKVRSLVTWTEHQHSYAYELETILYDWK